MREEEVKPQKQRQVKNNSSTKSKGVKNNATSKKQKNKNKKSPKKKSKKQKQQHKPAEQQELTLDEQGRYVALDCEFVGVGPGGYESALARVSLVDWNNAVLLDTHVRVSEPVTDYRTFVSGVREEHLQPDVAMESEKCIAIVEKLLQGRILVGHGLKNDLTVLGITHPWYNTRDTAKYEPFMKKAKKDSTSTLPRPRKLKDLALTKLDRVIQKEGESHCSIEDSIAALDLYKKTRGKWEKAMEYKVGRTQEIECDQAMFDEE